MSSLDPIRHFFHTCCVLSGGQALRKQEVCCSLPCRHTQSSQEDRRTMITKATGGNRATTTGYSHGGRAHLFHQRDFKTLITSLLRWPRTAVTGSEPGLHPRLQALRFWGRLSFLKGTCRGVTVPSPFARQLGSPELKPSVCHSHSSLLSPGWAQQSRGAVYR